VKHVDSATALSIAAYIMSYQTPKAPENLRLFQPGGSTVGGDVEFAVALFGQDAWPANLTTSQLLAVDPLNVRIAPPLLVWSDEGSNLEWMPDSVLRPAILDYAGGRARSALATYYASPTAQNLEAAVSALHAADHDGANPGAPCMFFIGNRVNYPQCFEVRRWTSSLVAQHMLRHGISGFLGAEMHMVWWDVGDAARRSRGKVGQIAHAVQNWALWMYIGWMFDPARVPAIYTVGGLREMGLPRHAAFIALRSLVARPFGNFDEDVSPYMDLVQVAAIVPDHWAASAGKFALRALFERLDAGERAPNATETDKAVAQVDAAVTQLAPKVSSTDLTALTGLANQVKAKLRT